MFIVKRGSDLIRFGLFLLVVAALVWYVVGRFDTWRSAGSPSPEPAVADGPAPAPAVTLEPDEPAEPAVAQASEGADYFAEYRIERERTRGALGDRLKEVMSSPGASAEVQQAAAQQYLELGRSAALESQAEAMVKARGFADVIVHLSDGSAQVVVRAVSLTQQQVAQIMDTVSRITGVKPATITVMARGQ